MFTLTAPCPSTGETGHRCPGFIRDQFIPLCAGGADDVRNMWREDIVRAAEKDRRELGGQVAIEPKVRFSEMPCKWGKTPGTQVQQNKGPC